MFINTAQRRNILSHIVTLKVEIKDAVAVRAACQRLALPEPVQGTHKLFGGEATGLAVKLTEWIYPVVCDTASGQVKFDNFNGRWGDTAYLDRFLQAYAVCKAVSEAKRRGHSVSETAQADGSVKLTIQVNGGAA